MSDQPDFFWSYLPFWVVTYGLALIAWTCVGRFLLSGFLPPDTTNYIYRFFCLLTNWAVAATAFVTPRFVLPRLMPVVTAFWAFMLRYVAYVIFARYGLAPSLGVSG